MTKFLMQVVGLASGQPLHAGEYLEWYDPERPARQALAGFTRDPAKAKRFDSVEALHAEWTRVRKHDGGKRPDGKPDRPLTAFTVATVPVDE